MYYNHALIKESAKACFNDNTGTAIGVVAFASGMAFVYNLFSSFFDDNYHFTEENAVFYTSACILAVAFYLLFQCVYEVGVSYWFLKAIKGERPQFKDSFKCFSSFYVSSIKIVLLKTLYIFLWYLLFVIPGIIKYYSYFAAYYIVTENPSIPASKAIDLSKRMMEGHKMDVFYLQLSFIGWQILSAFTCGILSIVYVIPWFSCTMAQAYNVIKIESIENGKVYEEEFFVNSVM